MDIFQSGSDNSHSAFGEWYDLAVMPFFLMHNQVTLTMTGLKSDSGPSRVLFIPMN